MRRLFPLVIVIMFSLAACTTTTGTGGYDLAEFSITGPTTLGSGAQSIDMTNSGEFAHTLVITDSSGRVVASTDLVQPGESADLDVELDAGVYQFTCRIVAEKEDGTIVDHFQEGMSTRVAVQG